MSGIRRIAVVNAEDLVPRSQRSFPLHQLAKYFECSVKHLFNLITEGEIFVPQEQIENAPSRSRIVVSRESVVDFVRRRLNSTENLARKQQLRRKRKQAK
jgi:hypothetical protein